MQEELIEESLWEDVTGVAEEEHDVVYVPRKKPVIEKTEKEMDVDWQRQRLANRPPIILTNLTDRSVAIGSTVKLTCNVAGPEVTARWLKNDAEVERSQKLQYRASDGMQILEITNVDRKDVGVYTCVVKNKNGSLSTSAKVSVFDNLEDKPTTPVMVSIRDYFHVYMNALILECHVHCTPRPMVKWFKDDEEIWADHRYQLTYEGTEVFQLIITHPEASDSGVYTCLAHNGIAAKKISHTVKYTPIPKRINKYEMEALEDGVRKAPARPLKREPYVEQSFVIRDSKNKLQFDAQFSNRTAIVGGSVKFICSVSGPQPTFKWSKDDKPMVWSNKIKNLTRECIGEVEITELALADAGTYTCIVKNPYGSIQTSSILKVVQTIDSDYTPPTFTRSIKESYSILEDDLVLEVHVRGHPAPEIKWFKETEPIFAFERHQISREADGCWKLSINHPDKEDSGRYFCHAINLAGKAKVMHVVDFKSTKESARVPGIYKSDHITRKYNDENDSIYGNSKINSLHSTRENSANPGNPTEEDTKKILAPSSRPRRTSRTKRYEGPSEPYIIRDSKKMLQFESQLKDQTAVVGSTVKLLCSVTGPGPAFKWTKNDKPLVWSPKIKNLTKEGFGGVSIIGATLDDAGVYKCTIKNGHTSLETTSNVQIFANPVSGTQAPTITRVTDYYNIQVDDLILEVQVEGMPRPTMKWFRDGVELKQSDKYFVMREPEGVYKLCIHEPDRNDGGRYVIQAKNTAGKTQVKHFVTFLGKDKYVHVAGIYHADPKAVHADEEEIEEEVKPVVPVPEAEVEYDEAGEPIPVEPKKPKDPRRWERDDRAPAGQGPLLIRDSKNRLTLDAQLRDRTVMEGSNVKLLVSVSGPGPNLRWFRNNIPLVWSKTVKNLTREGFGGIQLFNVTEADSAVYKCVVKNTFTELETSCRLTVFNNPNLTAVAPTFTRNVKEYYNMQVNDLILEFHVRGTPTPKIKWFKDCIEIEEWDHFFVLREPDGVYKFTIHNPTRADTGRYVCQAQNSAGKVTMRHDITKFNKEDFTHVHGISYSDPTVFSQYLEDERIREIENEKQREIDKQRRLEEYRIKKAIEEEERLEAERLEEERLAREAAGENGEDEDEDGEEEEEEVTGTYAYESYETHETVVPEIEDSEAGDEDVAATDETAEANEETTDAVPEEVAEVEAVPLAEIVPEVPAVPEKTPEPEVIPETIAEREFRRTARLLNLMNPKKEVKDPSGDTAVEPKYQLAFIAGLKDRTAIEGTQFKLFCSVNGYRPDIKFFKNNIPMVYGPKCKNLSRESLGGVMFPSIVPEDSGVYTCTAKNNYCEISCSARLTVIPKPKPKGEKLRFPRGIKESYNLQTDELILETYITGDIRPQITWYKDCREIECGDKYFIGRDGNLHRLHISKPTRRDSGTYMIKAENDSGSEQIKVNVDFVGKDEHFHVHGVYHADTKEKMKQIEELMSMPKPEPIEEEMVEVEVDMEIEEEVTDSEQDDEEEEDEDEDENAEEEKVEVVPEVVEEVVEEEEVDENGEKVAKKEPAEPVVVEKLKKMKKVKKIIKIMRFVPVVKPEPVVVPEPEPVVEPEAAKEEPAEGAEPTEEGEETAKVEVVDTKPKRNRNLPTDPVPAEPKVKLEFISRLLNRIVQKGKNIKLSCCASNSNKIEVTWTKNGVPLEFGARCRNNVTKEGFCALEVLRSTVADSGRYRCTVKTTEGVAFTECDVTVFEVEAPSATLVPPTFIVAPQDTYHPATNELILECRVRGNPKPTVEWIRDGCFIMAGEKYEFFNQEDGTCQLIVNNPNKYKDSGKYTIAAQNSVNKVEVSHNVVFEGKKEEKKKIRYDEIKLENDVRPRAAPKPEPEPIPEGEEGDEDAEANGEDGEATEEE